MSNTHRPLVIALRVFGTVDFLAVLAVAMPREWMEVIHVMAGLGEMPEGPLVDYLARSASMLYAVHGAMILFVSCDVKRYRPLVTFLGVITIAQGFVVLAIDIFVGMSLPWTVIEAPCFVGAGVMVLVAQRVCGRGE